MTPLESKAQLVVLGDDAADTARWMVRRSSGAWESRRLQLLDAAPGVIGYYSEATAALAADFYDDQRSKVKGERYAADSVVLDRTVKIRRRIAWASEPLSLDDDELAAARLAQVMQSELNRPYRDTIITNRKRDPLCVGWKRVTDGDGCAFCRALAARGAVYREATAYFAAHEDCSCTCAPVFRGEGAGPEADVMQYMASSRKRRKSPAQKQRLRDWISQYE